MTAGRKPMAAAIIPANPGNLDEDKLHTALTTVDHFAAEQAAITENAIVLAKQIGYEGSLTVGSLEDEIRFFQRRTAEACLEMGKRLILLKEITVHGEFQQRVDLLGIGIKMARKFMSAAVRFSKGSSTSLLKAANSQTKMLELLVLDDEELEAIDSGDSVRGITLDKVETMTVSELRAALRKAESVSEAKDRLLMGKEAKINELAKSLALAGSATPDETLAKIRHEVAKRALDAETTLENSLRPAVRALMEHHATNGGDSHEVLDGYLLQLERVITETRQEFGIDGGRAPSWVNAE